MNLSLRTSVHELIARYVCAACACVALLAVISISAYCIISGLPALLRIGVGNMVANTIWAPTAHEPSFGILYIIAASLLAAACSVAIGLPLSILTSLFLTEIAPAPLSRIVSSAIELLAGIPSVIYGLLGMVYICPLLYSFEKVLFAGSTTHNFSGGSNMLACVCVLVVMILPTMVSVSVTALQAVSDNLRNASYALGATRLQTIFKIVLPGAKSGICTGIILAIGRALGEAMAISMVAGGVVQMPLPFDSVRLLTTQLVSEMGYAQGLHREALFAVGLVLYLFIIAINVLLAFMRRKKRVYAA